MTSDDQIESYLTSRSTQIDLPHANVEHITTRARLRRNRRRVARGGIAAAVLLGGIAFVAGQSDEEPVTNLAGAAVVPSELEWTIAPTEAGLGWSQPIVADDGTVYALSTAANPGPGETISQERVVYRSTDGGEWEAVGSPDGLFASSLATGDGALYALGTTAAGGTTGPVDLAVSTDGGDTWDSAEVPFDPAAEHPDFPGTVGVAGADVAVNDGRTVVALQIQGYVDPRELMDPGDDPDQWYPVATGLERVPMCPTTTADGAAPTSTAPPASAFADDAAREAEAGARSEVVDIDGTACDPTDVDGDHRSWDELGVDPSVGTLVTGYTVVLAGPTDGDLSRVDDLSGVSFHMVGAGSLVAARDGFWFVGYQVPDGVEAATLTTWHSVDGLTWTASDLSGTEPADIVTAGMGTVDGRAVVLSWDSGSLQLHVLGGGTAIDLAQLLDIGPGSLYLYGWGFGPMGVALVVGQDDGPPQVVTSSDGVSYSVQEIPLDEMAEPGQKVTVNGVTVTADAIKVRVNARAADDLTGGAPLAQLLYVGTPA